MSTSYTATMVADNYIMAPTSGDISYWNGYTGYTASSGSYGQYITTDVSNGNNPGNVWVVSGGAIYWSTPIDSGNAASWHTLESSPTHTWTSVAVGNPFVNDSGHGIEIWAVDNNGNIYENGGYFNSSNVFTASYWLQITTNGNAEKVVLWDESVLKNLAQDREFGLLAAHERASRVPV